MIQIKDNKIELNRTVQLSNMQLYKLKNINNYYKQDYILTLLGLKRSRISVPKFIRASDALAVRKNSIIYLLQKSKDNSSQVTHKPLSKRGDWVGIEL